MSRTDPPAVHDGPILQEVKMHLYTPAKPAVGVCTKNDRCTLPKSASFVRHIEFDVSGTGLAGQILPGQSFGVIPPGVDEHGKPHKVRLYSVASPSRGEDGAGRIIATTVKRTIDEHTKTGKLFLGVASNYLCNLHPGDKATLTGPSGKRFVLPVQPEEHDYIFFATGTGIAPFRSMLLELLGRGIQSRIVLIMGSAYSSDLLYHADLLAMEAKHPNFTYLSAISREKQADGHGPLYVQDRLETHRDLFMPMIESPRTLVYICGIAGMELGIFRHLAANLAPGALEQYLQIEPAAADPRTWVRAMVGRQIKPSRRIFVEVY